MRHWWLALLLLWGMPSADVDAQPVVHVRAETRLEVATEPADAGAEVRGTLRDDAGTPLPGRAIAVTFRGEHPIHLRLQTDAEGDFSALVPPDMESAELRFEGEEFLMASAANLRLNDRRAHVTLRVNAPGGGRLSLDIPQHLLTIQAESDRGGDGLQLTLANELGQMLAAGTTDHESRWEVTIPSSELGSPGVGRLVVRSGADERRVEAQTEVPIVRSRATDLQLEQATLSDTGLQVVGMLQTNDRALERRAVSVLVDGELAGTALTDLSGRLSLLIPPEGLPSDGFDVLLRFDSDAPWLLSSESRTIQVTASRRRWVLPVLALISVLIALALTRWPFIRASEAQSDAAKATAGVALQKAANRAEITQISGTIVRAGAATSVPLARIQTSNENGTVADDLGGFSLTLPHGAHTANFEASGYEPLSIRISIPHRGEWSGVTVRLRNRRDLANELMLDAFAPRIPREDWGAATNRELFAKARERGSGSVELLALVDAVESLVYEQRPPEQEDLARIHLLAQATRTLPR